MQTLEMIGSEVDHFQCPWCGCHDRERHLFFYLAAKGFLPDLSGRRVLHFAPEQRLAVKVAAAQPEQYIRCDLYPQSSDVWPVDLLNMPFDRSSFDLVIANHVLEHVLDDLKGLKEICRVLRPGGHAILQTPYCAKLHQTWSDAGIDTAEARLQAYGQEDHVRVYGRDIFDRFEAAGLQSMVGRHHDLLPDISCKTFGLNEAEPFFLFQKPE